MVKQPLKNKGVYAELDAEQAKERRRVIIVATITIVLILSLIASVIIYGINSNKKSSQTPVATDNNTQVEESKGDTSDGSVLPPNEGATKEPAKTTDSQPVVESTNEIAQTGPADILLFALTCGGLTTILAYFIESKKA